MRHETGSEAGMTCSFSLPRPLASARFVKVEEVVTGWWVHRLRISEVEQLDAQPQGWLRRSYRLMGMQERLKGAPKEHRKANSGSRGAQL
jgi:hypothetical protein